MKRSVTILSLLLTAVMAMAQSTQSLKVCFNGSDNANWVVSSGGTAVVENGLMTVTMALQSNEKYRADLQCNTKDIYSMDQTKDVVWAVKLAKDIPGNSNAKKFEFQYVNAEGGNSWVNGINYPSGNIPTADGGKIYYFNLGADAYNKIEGMNVSDPANVAINQIHFIFADATGADEYTYSVDWVATFATVDDLAANADMLDDASDVQVQGAIFNETQMKSFADLAYAIEAANAGDQLLVNETQTLNSRINIDKALTIKAGAEGVALVRGESNSGLVVLAIGNADTDLTLEGLILDGANKEVAGQYLEASGKTTLKNCVIKNNISSSVLGNVCTKGSYGRLTIDGCAFENNSVSAENAGVLFNGTSLKLMGNVTFSGNTGHDIYLENKYLTAAKEDIQWETPINLYYKTPEADKIVIGGGAWDKGLTAFAIANEGWYLYIPEGSTNGDILLTQTPTTGIGATESANAANGARYDLTGRKAGANAKGLVIIGGKKYILK